VIVEIYNSVPAALYDTVHGLAMVAKLAICVLVAVSIMRTVLPLKLTTAYCVPSGLIANSAAPLKARYRCL
jgi:hypothetical protein